MGPDNEEAGERVEGVRALSTFAVLGEERDGGKDVAHQAQVSTPATCNINIRFSRNIAFFL